MENLLAKTTSLTGPFSAETIYQTLQKGLGGRFKGQKVLILVPDHTRSLPLPLLFRTLLDVLDDSRQLDFMVALGTHPALSDDSLNRLFGISDAERGALFAGKRIALFASTQAKETKKTVSGPPTRLFNHRWDDPTSLASLGTIEKDQIRQISAEFWHPSMPEEIAVRLNKAALDHDQILIVGPTFPHEVVGFSGGEKYLFPGISGPEMINASHWLGALAGVVKTIGIKKTPVRDLIHAAAARLATPVTLVGLVVHEHDLVGMYIGDAISAWEAAADLSARCNIQWVEKPFTQVLSCAPPMYEELWTAAKAMYKLEPAVAPGGEVIIYAPHLDTISQVHGKYIYDVGYHILPYFLENWDRFKYVPLSILAHSTHVRGSGHMENGVEKPNVRVTLASKVSAEDCARLNLGYCDPNSINIGEWQDRENEGVLYVARAGEVLYRLKESNRNIP